MAASGGKVTTGAGLLGAPPLLLKLPPPQAVNKPARSPAAKRFAIAGPLKKTHRKVFFMELPAIENPVVPDAHVNTMKSYAGTGAMVMLTVIDSSPPPCRTPLIGGQAL